MKLKAPMAVSIEANPVTKITGRLGHCFLIESRTSIPLFFGIFKSRIIRSYLFSLILSSAESTSKVSSTAQLCFESMRRTLWQTIGSSSTFLFLFSQSDIHQHIPCLPLPRVGIPVSQVGSML